jgi:hypothetical protein
MFYFFFFTEPVLVTLENSAEIFNALSDIPGDIVDIDNLLEVGKQFKHTNNTTIHYLYPIFMYILRKALSTHFQF